MTLSRNDAGDKIAWQGVSLSVQPRIRLTRSFDRRSHNSCGAQLYQRKRYRSLSEIAQLITGAHWNGPQFFGLRTKQREASHGAK